MHIGYLCTASKSVIRSIDWVNCFTTLTSRYHSWWLVKACSLHGSGENHTWSCWRPLQLLWCNHGKGSIRRRHNGRNCINTKLQHRSTGGWMRFASSRLWWPGSVRVRRLTTLKLLWRQTWDYFVVNMGVGVSTILFFKTFSNNFSLCSILEPIW